MAGADMRSKTTDRRTGAVAAEVEAKKSRQQEAKGQIPALDAYLRINNPNSGQQRDQITLLTNAALQTVRGVIGG